VAASFPFLTESVRTVISRPGHFVELGSLLFAVLALHEVSRRRMATSLIALLLALLCKEVAVIAVPLIPLFPHAGGMARRERVRWAVGAGLLGGVWALAYVAVRHRAHLELPHNLETSPQLLAVSPVVRMIWGTWNSLRALVSLPLVHVKNEWWILG